MNPTKARGRLPRSLGDWPRWHSWLCSTFHRTISHVHGAGLRFMQRMQTSRTLLLVCGLATNGYKTWNTTINKRQMFLETASRQVESSKSKSKAQKHDVHNLHNVHAYAAYMCNCVQLTQRWSMAVLNIQDNAFLLEATRKLRRLSGTKNLLNPLCIVVVVR